jgi:pantetheine-phosphate adenylyltransferase
MKKIGFSGTLDPITNGHMWVIEEARTLADEVIVFISENPLKKCQFSAEERKKIIEMSVKQRDWHNISVVIVKGDYTARVAKTHGVDYLIRGIRNTADFDYENLLQQTNVDVLNGAKTIFAMPPRDLGSVSSSFIKGLQGPVGWHWLSKKFVPPPAYDAWIMHWLRQEWELLWSSAYADAEKSVIANHWFDQLTGGAAYGAVSRHYHNLDHLVHGLTEIKVWAVNAGATDRELDTLKQAFWFHDAVYGQQKKDISDEEASAQLWLGCGLDTEDVNGTASLIRATDHFQQKEISHPLKDILLGADLAILGQHQAIYDAYALAIRAEYASVPLDIFNHHRREALSQLCEKARNGQLYASAYFSRQYSERAIENMTRELMALK